MEEKYELESLLEQLEEINKQLASENIDPFLQGQLDGKKILLKEKIKDFKINTPIPETLELIRKEMDLILGKSIFEGIENENEFAIYNQLDENEITEFQELRTELNQLLDDPKANKTRIDEIRMEMFLILNIDPFTYQNNQKIIDSLNDVDKIRFESLKSKHIELMDKMLKERKKQQKPEETEADKLRARMAEILYKDPKKAYDGIEHENENDPNRNLTEEEKKEFGELRDKLNKVLGRTKLIPVSETKPVPIQEPEPKKKKGRLVKAWESAKKFYKKHKKAILIVAGLVLFAVAMQALLPSIMLTNSVLWSKAVGVGATGLPTVLHDINLIIGKQIGATFTSGNGIWTLANGTVLNAGAAEAGLLASLGKVALSVGAASIGATTAIKNGYKLAKEKIQNFRNKRAKNPEEKKQSIFESMKESFKAGYAKSKEKITKKTEDSTKNEENVFYREDISERNNKVIQHLIKEGIITEEEKKELETIDKDELMTKVKEITNSKLNSQPDSKKTVVEFDRKDIPYAVNEYIKAKIRNEEFNEKNIKSLNEMDATILRDLIYGDPHFVEFEKLRTSKEVEESKEETLGGTSK